MSRGLFAALCALLCAAAAGCAGERGDVYQPDIGVGSAPVSDASGSANRDVAAAPPTPAQDGASVTTDSSEPAVGEHRVCQRVCSTPSDCCDQPPCSAYPNRFSCIGGYCKNEGCESTPDCAADGAGRECMPIDGFNVCAQTCAGDEACTMFPGEQCVDQRYCQSSTPAGYPSCAPDKPCPDIPGIAKCYEARGRCGCTDETSCQVTAAAGGTWRCAPLQ